MAPPRSSSYYGNMLTPQALAELLERKLNARFIVVSDPQPVFASESPVRETAVRPPSGALRAALDAIMRATGGLWVARANGEASRNGGSRACVSVPPGLRSYTLKRVAVPRDLEKRYYEGMGKQALWPLCHNVFQRPLFERENWLAYRQVNRLFADAVAEEVRHEEAVIFIQDYHLAPLAAMLRERCPNIRTAHFWHVPWPAPATLGILPWRNEFLAELLDNDLIGFQVPEHAANFTAAAARFLGATCSGGRVSHVGCQTYVRAFPIGVNVERIETLVRSPEVIKQATALRAELNLGSCFVVVSVDRFDSAKGIPERLRAVEMLLDTRPEYRGRLVFVQVAAPSRMSIPGYQSEETQAAQVAARINRKYGRQGWQPIELLRETLPPERVCALYRLADVCVVGSLHAGMSLTAKEFVASRVEGSGALVLSAFAGAAEELKEAIVINPFCVEEFADALAFALEMSPDETELRMQRLRERVANGNIYDWAGSILETLCQAAETRPRQRPGQAIEAGQLAGRHLSMPGPALLRTAGAG